MSFHCSGFRTFVGTVANHRWSGSAGGGDFAPGARASRFRSDQGEDVRGSEDAVALFGGDFSEKAVFGPELDGLGDVLVAVAGALCVLGDGKHGGGKAGIEDAGAGGR